jgi:hypothetical protein
MTLDSARNVIRQQSLGPPLRSLLPSLTRIVFARQPGKGNGAGDHKGPPNPTPPPRPYGMMMPSLKTAIYESAFLAPT